MSVLWRYFNTPIYKDDDKLKDFIETLDLILMAELDFSNNLNNIYNKTSTVSDRIYRNISNRIDSENILNVVDGRLSTKDLYEQKLPSLENVKDTFFHLVEMHKLRGTNKIEDFICKRLFKSLISKITHDRENFEIQFNVYVDVMNVKKIEQLIQSFKVLKNRLLIAGFRKTLYIHATDLEEIPIPLESITFSLILSNYIQEIPNGNLSIYRPIITDNFSGTKWFYHDSSLINSDHLIYAYNFGSSGGITEHVGYKTSTKRKPESDYETSDMPEESITFKIEEE